MIDINYKPVNPHTPGLLLRFSLEHLQRISTLALRSGIPPHLLVSLSGLSDAVLAAFPQTRATDHGSGRQGAGSVFGQEVLGHVSEIGLDPSPAPPFARRGRAS